MFWRRQPWFYLGWTALGFDQQRSIMIVHFYARGINWEKRKIVYNGRGTWKDPWQYHQYMQEKIVPWLSGDGFVTPIYHPSENLIIWMSNFGWVWEGDHWTRYEEVPTANDNVIQLSEWRK